MTRKGSDSRLSDSRLGQQACWNALTLARAVASRVRILTVAALIKPAVASRVRTLTVAALIKPAVASDPSIILEWADSRSLAAQIKPAGFDLQWLVNDFEVAPRESRETLVASGSSVTLTAP